MGYIRIYHNFYVYQYATSFTASSALSNVYSLETRSGRTAYLDLLASGDRIIPSNG